MKLTFLGSGSAFTVGCDNYHSNMILENDSHEKLLVDCGSDARLALHELGLTYADIKSVYISHLHADHCGGLEWLGFTTRFDPRCLKPDLFISDKIKDDLWKNSLSGGLSSVQGITADLSTFFNVHPVKEEGVFVWHGLEIKLVQTIHVVAGFNVVPSYGLMFKANGICVFITTDTQFSPHQIIDFYEMADIIFHDCETSATKSGVHAQYAELSTLPSSIKQKMWLYHYNPGKLPDAKKDGFRGFVKKGQSFDFKKAGTLK